MLWSLQNSKMSLAENYCGTLHRRILRISLRVLRGEIWTNTLKQNFLPIFSGVENHYVQNSKTWISDFGTANKRPFDCDDESRWECVKRYFNSSSQSLPASRMTSPKHRYKIELWFNILMTGESFSILHGKTRLNEERYELESRSKFWAFDPGRTQMLIRLPIISSFGTDEGASKDQIMNRFSKVHSSRVERELQSPQICMLYKY